MSAKDAAHITNFTSVQHPEPSARETRIFQWKINSAIPEGALESAREQREHCKQTRGTEMEKQV